jgi:hypothetical protein
MKEILPSTPKGEIVGNMAMAKAKLTQIVKVVIDGNRLCVENRCRNTEAATQMRTATTQMQTQTLKHSAETELEHRS